MNHVLFILICLLSFKVEGFVIGSLRDVTQKTLTTRHQILFAESTRESFVADESAGIFQNGLKCLGAERASHLVLGRDTMTGLRGVFSSKLINTEESIVRIPFSAAIVIEEDETTPAERGYQFMKILEQQQEDAIYKSYLDLLPTQDRDFDPTPEFWSQDEIMELELPELVEEVLELKSDLVEAASSKSDCTEGDLMFAAWLVKSRAFSIVEESDDMDQEPKVKCVLIPYIDMINHSSNNSNAQLQIYEEQDTGKYFYELVSTQPISEGEEILLSYGTGEDETIDLLMNYGFVPSENVHDVYAFEDDTFQWKTSLESDWLALQSETNGSTRKTILQLRIKIKRAMQGQEGLCD